MSPVVIVSGGPKPEEVMENTWGHLRAQPNVRHPGEIVFAEGAFGGERFILSVDFGDDAGDGPWFYEQIHEWLWEQDIEPGMLYRFTGWYREEGNSFEFQGEITATPWVTP